MSEIVVSPPCAPIALQTGRRVFKRGATLRLVNSEEWTDAARRGVDALDFAVSQFPGEPAMLVASHARPPEDAEGYQAMVAASQFSLVVSMLANTGRHPEAIEARDLHWNIVGATGSEQRRELLARYPEVLARAFASYLAGAEAERIADLLSWYERMRRSVDG